MNKILYPKNNMRNGYLPLYLKLRHRYADYYHFAGCQTVILLRRFLENLLESCI